MKIYYKLALGFFSTSLIVAATTCISLITNKEIQHDLTQISQSSIDEVKSAAEMVCALQAIQTDTQHLLAEKYERIAGIKHTPQSEGLTELQAKLDREVNEFTAHLAGARKASKTGIQLVTNGSSETKEIKEEKEELRLLDQVQAEFLVHKKLIEQYLLVLAKHPIGAEKFLYEALDSHFEHKLFPLIKAYEASANAELTREIKEVEVSLFNGGHLIISSAFVTLLVAIFLSRLIAISIANPIVKLKNVVIEIGKGSLDTKVNILSNDEVGVLANSFNKMVKDLSMITVSKVYVDNILSSMIDSLIVVNLDAIIIKVNQATLELLDYEESELISKSIGLLFTEGTPIGIDTLLQKGFVGNVETTYLTKDSRKIPVSLSASVIRDGQGKIQGFVYTAQNITERKQTEEALRQAEAKYRNIFENALEGIFQSTPQGHYIDVNPALARIYGYESPDDLLTNLSDIRRQLYVEPDRRAEFVRLMQEHNTVSNFESQIYRKNGSLIWISENARAVYDTSGVLAYYEGSVEDITERKQTQEQLRHNALHDALTGLPNRTLFTDRLEQMVQRTKRHKNHLCAVLFLDLDRFKMVNDSLGHLIGDQLLIAVARKMEMCLRPEDTVARFGGDEFAILLNDIKDVNYATQIAERLIQVLALPFNLSGQNVSTSASIGIVLGSEANSRLDDLLRNADIAMYQAKARGKGRYEVFNTSRQQCGVV